MRTSRAGNWPFRFPASGTSFRPNCWAGAGEVMWTERGSGDVHHFLIVPTAEGSGAPPKLFPTTQCRTLVAGDEWRPLQLDRSK